MTLDTKSLKKIDELLPDVSLEEITKIIAASSAKASAIAVLPIPIVDIAGVTFIQVRMINQIAEKYNKRIGDNTKLIISSFASNLLGKLVTLATEELAATAKVDKLLGETLIKATIAGFVTTIIGEVYAYHFKNGGTSNDISLNGTIDYFKRQLSSDRLSVENMVDSVMSGLNTSLV